MRIECGPTLERQIRTLLMTLMVGGFAGWFAYDGWIGYPKENLKEHLSSLPPEERPEAEKGRIYPSVAPEILSDVQKAIREGVGADAQKSRLGKLFGGPPTHKTEEALYYFGPTHRLKIPLRAGLPVDAEIRPAARKPTDLAGQKILAGVLGVLGLYSLWCLWRVRRTHVLLDDNGLAYNRRGPVSWDQMTGLDSARFNAKGFVDLVYQGNGAQRKLRLDEYHLAAFDEIIDAICTRRGFQNPLPVDDPPAPPGSPT